MKITFITLLLSLSTLLTAQKASDVFTAEELVYYGLDFSQCRLIGDFGNGDGYAMRTKMFPSWNEVVVKEQNKFDFHNAFRKKSIFYDLNSVAAANDQTVESKILTLNDNNYTLSPEQIQSMVSSYKSGEKTSGTAVVFIVEKFNKNEEKGYICVTFFDIASKKVLFTERVRGSANGIGLRNYWANSVYNVIREITDYKYNNWKKVHG